MTESSEVGDRQVGSRAVLRGASALMAVEAVLLLAAVPVIALMLLGSLWEGGDTNLKHRLLGWGLLALAGNLVGVVLFGIAAGAVLRPARQRRGVATAAGILLVALGSGWAFVFQGYLLDLATFAEWALLLLPGLAGVTLALVARPRQPQPG